MGKRKITLSVIPFIIAVIIMTGCIKDEIDLNNISKQVYWNPKIGVPVAYGNLTIDDLIESIDSAHNVHIDENNFLTLIYSNRIFSSKASDILKIQNQQFGENLLESDYSLPPMPVQDTIVLTRSNKYTMIFDNGEVIDSVKLKGGTMIVHVSSSYKFKGALKIVVPKLVKNKKALEIPIDINKSDGSFVVTQNYDLTGYKLELTHPNVNDNLLGFDYSAKLVNAGNGISVGDKISIDINCNDINFSSMFGYIGQIELLNYQSSIRMPLFQNVSEPNIHFSNPKLKLKTANSFGVPALVEFNTASVSSDKDHITIPITFSPGVNPFGIKYPSSFGGVRYDSLIISSSTSNLDEALSIAPNNFNYDIRASANPAGKMLNYVTDSSKIDIDLDIELPLDLRTSLIEFSDTMDLNLSDIGDNSKNIKSFLLHSSFENGMPFDLNLQVILLDDHYLHVDTLFTSPDQLVVTAGTLNQQGRITSSTKKEVDISFPKNRIESLKNVHYALVKAGIKTINNGANFVKFYSDYALGIHFGVQTELEVNEQ